MIKEYETLYLEIEPPIARMVLNRPEVLNAISNQMVKDASQALDFIDEDEETRVIIVKGKGKAFCSGYDLKMPVEEFSATKPLHRDRDWILWQVRKWLKLWNIRKPTVAQVHGYCYAGGTTIAGLCDLIVAADNALFGQPESRSIGYPPELANWPFTIGLRKTKELLFTGDSITGKEAERIGMINKSIPEDKLENYVEDLAKRIALCSQDMLTYSKHLVNQVFEIMGFSAMIQSGVNFDVLGHHSIPMDQFLKAKKEKGTRAALEVRDGPWGGPKKIGK